MYTLNIANKNYPSWSPRPWVLMKELGIPFEESFTASAQHERPAASRLLLQARFRCSPMAT